MMARPDDAGRGRRPPRRAATWALGAASLVLALGVAELGFRLAGYSALYDLYSKPSLFWVRDELLGWSHQPNARGTYVGPRPFPVEFEAQIRINSNGLRGPELAPRVPGEYRVLVLGDSVTAGFEVAYEDTFPARLEKIVGRQLGAPVRVINAGVRGYGTDQHYLYYRERGRHLDPDLVLLQHSANDPGDNVTLHRMRRPFGKAALAPRSDGSLELVGHPIPFYPLCSSFMLSHALEVARVDGPLNRLLCHTQIRAADHSAVFSFASQALARIPWLVRRLKSGTQPEPQAGLPPGTSAPALAGVGAGPVAAGGLELERRVTTAILLELARSVAGDGADFFVFVIPQDLDHLDLERLAGRVELRFAAKPAAIEMDSLRFENDSHWNERGHRVVARGLSDSVLEYARRRSGGLSSGAESAPSPEEP